MGDNQETCPNMHSCCVINIEYLGSNRQGVNYNQGIIDELCTRDFQKCPTYQKDNDVLEQS